MELRAPSGQVLTEAEIRLQALVGVLVDLTTFLSTQREYREDSAANVVRHRFRFIKNGLMTRVWFVYLVTVGWKMLFRLARNADTRVLCLDKDRSSYRFDCTAKLSGESPVPASPQGRLVRYCL